MIKVAVSKNRLIIPNIKSVSVNMSRVGLPVYITIRPLENIYSEEKV